MLPLNRISYVTIASTLALLALVLLQVKWVSDSKQLIEEQFDQKVRMAVCSAVESLNREGGSPKLPSCRPVEAVSNGFQLAPPDEYDLNELDIALAQSLVFYDIPLAYEMDVLPKNACKQDPGSRQYCCALSPFEASNSDILSLRFPQKNSYIYGKMKLLLLSSFLILLFITFVFVFANHTLLRQKQIAQINKDFFNNMAHEFRTPLTNISLANNLLVKKNKALGENKFVKVVQEESRQLKEQVERVLQLASLENGEYELEKETLALEELIEQVLASMALQIKEKAAKITLEVEGALPLIMGDKFHLGNVFRNLIDNALKYSGQPATIHIVLRKSKEGILILFQDQGRGLAKKDQAYIFDKFHRVTHGNRHDQKGFGLGLPYVKMIVERHRGFIKIISDLNKGCRFDLFISSKS